MNETELLKRVTVNPKIFGGKPIILGGAVWLSSMSSGMLAAGDSAATIRQGYPGVGRVTRGTMKFWRSSKRPRLV